MTEPELRFQASGFLEPGIVDLTPDQILVLFGTNPWRFALFQSLDTVLSVARVFNDEILDIYVNGSFISTFPNPGDVDVLVITKTPETAVSIDEKLWILAPPGLNCFSYHRDDPPAAGFLEAFSKPKAIKYHGVSDRKGFARLKHG